MMGSDEDRDIRVVIARLEGKIDALTQLLAVYHTQVSRLEGRVWGLLVAVVVALGTAILGIAVR